jgi:uncharacterized membrane-anchored protein
MKQCHVPLLGLRYWIALYLASIFGANMGDIFAHEIGLGHVVGLPFLAIALAVVFALERFDHAAHEGYYWLAIVVVRTAATNLADFFSFDLRLSKLLVMAGLVLLLVLTVATGLRPLGRDDVNKNHAQSGLLRADFGYWLSMLIAGTLGTVTGDFFSHDLHLGDARASAVLAALLAPFFVLGGWQLIWTPAIYWATIVMVRAAGTVVGDFLASDNLLGLPLSTASTGMLFVALLIFWNGPKRDPIPTRAD